jgi:hypothetical protein
MERRIVLNDGEIAIVKGTLLPRDLLDARAVGRGKGTTATVIG